MTDRRWNPGAVAERRQLLFFATGVTVIAVGLLTFTARQVVPVILLSLGVLAAGGAVAYRWIGRGVYLVLSMLAALIGSVVSRAVVAVTYVLAIAGFGSLLRVVRMNRLERDFARCRRKETMLTDAPPTDRESFGRQS